MLAASCGIEPEIVAAASQVAIEGVGPVPVASAEDLLAMKLLSAMVARGRDWEDARSLLLVNPGLDLAMVRSRLDLIRARGYARREDLHAKLARLLEVLGRS